ncbi:hypothetical protein D3C86_1599310 [compost metagenome]
MAEVLHLQGFAVGEGAQRADRMQTAEQLAEAIELLQIARLRCAAAAPREQGEAKAGVLEQGFAVAHQWRHHRHLALGQLEGEAVLLANRRVGPALRPVELGDQRRFVLDAHLVDAVLVAVECQYARIAEVAKALHGIQHQVGGQCGKWVGHGRLRSLGRRV